MLLLGLGLTLSTGNTAGASCSWSCWRRCWVTTWKENNMTRTECLEKDLLLERQLELDLEDLSLVPHTPVFTYLLTYLLTEGTSFSCTMTPVKVKVKHLLYRTQVSQGHRRSAQVHGAHQAASHIPALNLPSHSRYSFTDHERMEGWVNPGLGCKEQLAHGCYDTARGQRDSNPNLTIVNWAHYPLGYHISL